MSNRIYCLPWAFFILIKLKLAITTVTILIRLEISADLTSIEVDSHSTCQLSPVLISAVEGLAPKKLPPEFQILLRQHLSHLSIS